MKEVKENNVKSDENIGITDTDTKKCGENTEKEAVGIKDDDAFCEEAEESFFVDKHGKEETDDEAKIFQRFRIKDIVFLAVMSAITLLTCSVMMLVVPLLTTVFGIAQLVTGLQLAVFPAIALSKVRKVGSMFLIAVFTGVIQLFMSPAMFINNVIVGLILEILVVLIFKGYKSDKAVFFAVALYNPLSLPFNYVYNKIINDVGMTAVAENAPWSAVGMAVAVCAVAVVGTLVGLKISKELKKAGVLKK